MGNINIFDLLIGASGVYLIYTALTMKKTGEIKAGVLVSKEMDAGRIKDKDGFINYMYVKTMILGVLSIAYGLAGIIDERLQVLGPIKYILLLAFLAVFYH